MGFFFGYFRTEDGGLKPNDIKKYNLEVEKNGYDANITILLKNVESEQIGDPNQSLFKFGAFREFCKSYFETTTS